MGKTYFSTPSDVSEKPHSCLRRSMSCRKTNSGMFTLISGRRIANLVLLPLTLKLLHRHLRKRRIRCSNSVRSFLVHFDRQSELIIMVVRRSHSQGARRVCQAIRSTTFLRPLEKLPN